jgi:hypothetical protein
MKIYLEKIHQGFSQFSLLMLAALCALAFPTRQVHADEPLPSLEEMNTISRKEFLEQLQPLFVDDFCKVPGSFFNRCFTISEPACKKTVETSFKTCVNTEVKVPEKVNIVLKGARLSERIGECLGEKYYQRHKKDFQRDNYCLAREKWL